MTNRLLASASTSFLRCVCESVRKAVRMREISVAYSVSSMPSVLSVLVFWKDIGNHIIDWVGLLEAQGEQKFASAFSCADRNTYGRKSGCCFGWEKGRNVAVCFGCHVRTILQTEDWDIGQQTVERRLSVQKLIQPLDPSVGLSFEELAVNSSDDVVGYSARVRSTP